MSGDSYSSLLNHAIYVMDKIKLDKNIMMLVEAIKYEYRHEGKWSADLLKKHDKLKKEIERKSYFLYNNDVPIGIEKLSNQEELEFIGYIRDLSTGNNDVDIRVQGKEDIELSNLVDSDLLSSQALRILPKNLKKRMKLRSSINARLTINIHKKYINRLTKSLVKLFHEPSPQCIEQAKIMGPRKFGIQTDQAVIYLSESGLEHAKEITQRLNTLIPSDAFIEHTPVGMQKMDTGISYSETPKGQSTSHGQARSQVIADAITEALLTDRPVKQILPKVLKKVGYDTNNPSLVAQVQRDGHLKNSLFDSMMLKKHRISQDIQRFVTDPLLFPCMYVIDKFNNDILSVKAEIFNFENEFTAIECGVLAQYITSRENSGFIYDVLDFTYKFNSIFRDSGYIEKRLAPQDFYLYLMDDNSGGRCYSLVRAMAVALALEGSEGANKLLNKMFLAGASPTEPNSTLLQAALKELHVNIEAAHASTIIGQFELNEIKEILINAEQGNIYALNSTTHSMLLGKVKSGNEINYYFYDPNFGIYAFNDSDKLFSTLNKFLFKNKMAEQYAVLNSSFELVSINTGKMSEVQIGSGLTVSDLVYSDNLMESISLHKKMESILEHQSLIAKDKKIQTSLIILESEKWGERLEYSINEVCKSHQLDEKWLPVFENVENLEDGRYRIQFIHQGIEEKIYWAETKDTTFIEFKEYFHKQMAMLKSHYSFSDGELQCERDIEGTEHVDGLNIAMGIQAIIQWSENRNRQSVVSSRPTSNLATALRIHSYISYSMMAHGAINDAVKTGKIAYSLWCEGNGVAKSVMNRFSSSLVRTANEGLGVIFQGAMVGFDIYELANAQNETQRAVFGTQLAFDSSSLGLGIVSTGASLLGAETVAGVAGPLAVPLMGIGIGITELVNINERHAQKAVAVGEEFAIYQRDYQNAAISYDAKKDFLVPTPNIVIEKLDFKNGYFDLGSQYIYRGVKKKWYIEHCWLNDFQSGPSAEIDKSHAINIREAVGVTEPRVNFNGSQTGVVILPVVPKSFIRYRYSSLFGGTSRGDNGFSILRGMEERYQFYFDFFYCGLEYVITTLEHEYENTTIHVNLDSQNRQLTVPKMPIPWQGHITHAVTGNGGEYQITVNYGASLTLIEGAIYGKQSSWIIDTSLIESDGKEHVIQIMDDHIKISGITINVDTSVADNSILLVNAQHEVCEIDFINKTAKIINLDGSQWINKSQTIKQHLHDLSIKNKLNGQYVAIDNYQYNGLNVGRAFYDVQYDRVIFTHSKNKENHSAQLIKINRDTAYFYSSVESVIWQVDINTGSLLTQLKANMVLGLDAEIIKVTLVDDQLYITLTERSTGSTVENTYRLIQSDKLELVSVVNNRLLLDNLHDTQTLLSFEQRKQFSSHDYLACRYMSPEYQKTITIKPSIANTVMISGTDENGFWHHYWLRNESGTLVKANLERKNVNERLFLNEFISISEEDLKYIDCELAKNTPLEKVWRERFALSISDGKEAISQLKRYRIKPTLAKIFATSLGRYNPRYDLWYWFPPKDLELIGSLLKENGKEAFFFYSQKEDTIFYQKGLGQDIIKPNKPSAFRLNLSGIKNVTHWQGELLVIQKEGFVRQLDANGSVQLVALNKDWFAREPLRWERFAQFSNEKDPIALFGLKDTNGERILPAWYFNEMVVVAPSFSLESELQIIDFDHDKQYGVIFDSKSKKLYRINAIGEMKFNNIFDSKGVLRFPNKLPKHVDLYPELTFKSVQKIADGLMLLTEENAIIYHPTSSHEQLGLSLIIKGTPEDDVVIPAALGDVSVLILNGGEGSDTYQFKKVDWQRYQTIIIDNYSVDRIVDLLILPIKNQLKEIFINRQGDDLVITDSINNTSLYIRGIYGLQAHSYRHLQLRIDGTDQHIDVSLLAEQALASHGLMSLSMHFRSHFDINGKIVLLGELLNRIDFTQGDFEIQTALKEQDKPHFAMLSTTSQY
ncbi:TcdA/TcdB pore-forming domain-containing protein [Providencia sp. PROV221]|uniref:TcdA/TcdB pore-forming domain-containing protein n=1 Tax=Providencia sp. PROV221 TaxID=2949916 RepID=UPI0023494A9E|nr:TcdA/TcdB pore-forming domain-containing protein [Providencia sp. PROV221]